MKKLVVDLKENSYPIFIGDKIVSILLDEIEENSLYGNLLIIIDGNVEKFHGQTIRKIFRKFKGKLNYYILKPGERSKSYTELNKIYSFMLDKGYGRDSLLIAFGGGVTGDLAGFAASTFMRGIQLIHIPTTLLAAVDSSIGGKTGINFNKKKNMIGSFYQPKMVLIDTQFFKTLPAKEKTSGLGEVVKYAYLSDEKFYNFLLENYQAVYENESVVIEEIVYKSSSIKASVVSQDEKESGLRKILNLGHTFAHAFESEMNFKVKHGEAVIAGIIAAIFLSNKIKILSNEETERFLRLPLLFKLSQKFSNLDNEKIYNLMLHDKKNRSGKIKFVLINGIGKIMLDVEAKKREVFSALDKTYELINS